MVDWTSGTADASFAERVSAFFPMRVPGSPDVFKEAPVSQFLMKDTVGVLAIPDEGFDEKLRIKGTNSYISFLSSDGLSRRGYLGNFSGNTYIWNDGGGATIFGLSGVEGARFTDTANFVLGATATLASARLRVLSSSNGAVIQCGNGLVGAYMSNTSGTAAWQPFSFCNNGTTLSQIGSITCTSTATAYNTSSDYRLKNNIEDLSGSGDFIDALRPRKWLWNQDGSPGAGFIAHEFAEVSPSSVNGEKDGVREGLLVNEETGEEELVSEPAYQSMQASSPEVMAHIIAELQSLRARVAALESGQA